MRALGYLLTVASAGVIALVIGQSAQHYLTGLYAGLNASLDHALTISVRR